MIEVRALGSVCIVQQVDAFALAIFWEHLGDTHVPFEAHFGAIAVTVLIGPKSVNRGLRVIGTV